MIDKHRSGMWGFSFICTAQAVSLLGTAVSNFGLTLWVYEITGKATTLAHLSLLFGLPIIFLNPFIGVIVDRGNRKLLMMTSDIAAAVTILAVLILYSLGNLQVWHLYVTATVTGIFQGFHWPAYSAAISTMLPKDQYVRANSMLSLAGSGSLILGPILAGILFGPLGLGGLLVIDIISAAIAIFTLLLITIPQPAPEMEHPDQEGFLQDVVFGFRYILRRPSLLGLQALFMAGNFFFSLSFVVLTPMILARTGNDERILSSVLAAGAVGSLIGSVIIAAWGGPKQRIRGVLLGWFGLGFFGQITIGLSRTVILWVCGTFLVQLFSVLINTSNQAIWQAKVQPAIQGRVFSTRRFIAMLLSPLSYLIAGPLADNVLEPAMTNNGKLVDVFSWLVGTGAGAGMALMFIVGGLMVGITSVAGFGMGKIRDVEEIVPDHDSVTALV